ncbi:MAG: hypothetical protein WAW17_30255 [Rhodococcus sp. (in: high G+C Gram-positive bacteria)]|uniref:hypothetical protein n=1 Tax=Rhodococcus sp. TaxID=1831 RepID=UPI003BAEA055
MSARSVTVTVPADFALEYADLGDAGGRASGVVDPGWGPGLLVRGGVGVAVESPDQEIVYPPFT